MSKIFKQEYDRALKQPKISDQTGLQIFQRTLEQCKDESKAIEFYELANKDRMGSVREQHEAAYTYLALAFVALEKKNIEIRTVGEPVKHDKLFHFAGHAFREIGQLNRAADAYWRAGVTSKDGDYPTNFGIRSIARAKICYKEIGEEAKSDEMHRLEWEARRRVSRAWLKPFLGLWALTSRYGTSPPRWFMSMLIVVVFSTLLYEFMHRWLWIYQGQHWTPWVSALYYCVVTMTTLGYGEFVPQNVVAQVFVVFNVLAGYFLLAVGITILGRKVIGR